MFRFLAIAILTMGMVMFTVPIEAEARGGGFGRARGFQRGPAFFPQRGFGGYGRGGTNLQFNIGGGYGGGFQQRPVFVPTPVYQQPVFLAPRAPICY
jgi:hypothetical protein